MPVILLLLALLLVVVPAWGTDLGLNITGMSIDEVNLYTCDLLKASSEDWSTANGATNLAQNASGWPTAMDDSNGGGDAYVNVLMRRDLYHTDFTIPGELAHYPEGQYTVECTGQGTVGVAFDSEPDNNNITCPGTTTFTVDFGANSGGIMLKVFDTGLNAGNPPVVQIYPSGTNPRACDPDAYDGFNPHFLKALRPFDLIRLMDLMQPYHAALIAAGNFDWTHRTPLTYRTWVSADRGWPPEAGVLLANAASEYNGRTINPWFVFPITTTNDYHTNFAAYVLANLNANLYAGLEWCNECWNQGTAFNSQYLLCVSQATADGQVDPNKCFKWQGKRSTQVYDIWGDTFGGVTRLRRFIGVQNAIAPSLVGVYLDVVTGGDCDPARECVDEIVVAPYINPMCEGGATQCQLNPLNSTYDGVSNDQCGTVAANCTVDPTGDCPTANDQFDCCDANPDNCEGVRLWGPETYCNSFYANMDPTFDLMDLQCNAAEARTNGQGETIGCGLYEGFYHDSRNGGSQANVTGEWDRTFVEAGHAVRYHQCYEQLSMTYMDELDARGVRIIMAFLGFAKMGKFSNWNVGSEYTLDSTGQLVYCSSPGYRALHQWGETH